MGCEIHSGRQDFIWLQITQEVIIACGIDAVIYTLYIHLHDDLGTKGFDTRVSPDCGPIEIMNRYHSLCLNFTSLIFLRNTSFYLCGFWHYWLLNLSDSILHAIHLIFIMPLN